jgi:hypothetical protein
MWLIFDGPRFSPPFFRAGANLAAAEQKIEPNAGFGAPARRKWVNP